MQYWNISQNRKTKQKNAFTNSKKEKEAARFASQYSSTALALTMLGHAPLKVKRARVGGVKRVSCRAEFGSRINTVTKQKTIEESTQQSFLRV